MLIRTLTALITISLIPPGEAFRALVIFPVCSKSHDILAKGVVNNLLEAGHEVVHITCFPDKKRIANANLTELDISIIDERFNNQTKMAEAFNLKNLVGQNNLADSITFTYMVYTKNKNLLSEQLVADLLADKNQQFDVVVAEWLFSELVAGTAPLFQCPLIWLGTTEANWQILRLIDEVPNPAYSVDIFSTNSPPLDFLARASELWTLIRRWIVINCIIMPFERYAYNSIYPTIAAKRGISMPSYNDAIYNASLVFLNSHPSLGTPFRLPQNVKYIGGYHIDTKVNPLPKDLQKIMDQSRHGVIYFSMGSNLKSVDMSDQMRNSLLKMFSKLKQTVIWKFEEDLDNVPSNIHLLKWAPQQSILAHPNMKVFITHGGQLSTTEAIHFGVPVIGIPVFGDQYANMKSAEYKGFGITVKLDEDMAGALGKAIDDIVNNPHFKNKVKQLSMIYHARPMTPGKELVYWIDHVILTQGAPHLRSPAAKLPFYQKAYLDLLAVAYLILYLVYRVMKKIFGLRKSALKNVKKAKKS